MIIYLNEGSYKQGVENLTNQIKKSSSEKEKKDLNNKLNKYTGGIDINKKSKSKEEIETLRKGKEAWNADMSGPSGNTQNLKNKKEGMVADASKYIGSKKHYRLNKEANDVGKFNTSVKSYAKRKFNKAKKYVKDNAENIKDDIKAGALMGGMGGMANSVIQNGRHIANKGVMNWIGDTSAYQKAGGAFLYDKSVPIGIAAGVAAPLIAKGAKKAINSQRANTLKPQYREEKPKKKVAIKPVTA